MRTFFLLQTVLFAFCRVYIVMEQKGKGRPNKMNNWLPALEEVLNTENILFLSNDDLRLLTNERLPEENQISERTFKNWKAGKFHEDDDSGKNFIRVIERALIKQKQWLGERMLDPNNSLGWNRFRWILERKFAEFNLKHISENINRNEQTILITAASDEQKKLIENTINIEFEEVKPVRIQSSNDNESHNYDF